jgi:small subunit ribosomal protein S4
LKAAASKGATGSDMMKMIERRMDNVVYRGGLAKTRAQARQMVSHGLFTLNGTRVTVPSIQVRENDVIEVRPRLKESPLFMAVKEEKDFDHARWLKSDQKALKTEVAALPEETDLDQLIETQLIVEYYSK